MLVIRREQLDALTADFDSRLIAWMTEWLSFTYPHATTRAAGQVHKVALQTSVAAMLARSRRCGLESAADHKSFLLIAAVLGWDFFTQPSYAWIEDCLSNPCVSDPSQRMRNVLRALTNYFEESKASQ